VVKEDDSGQRTKVPSHGAEQGESVALDTNISPISRFRKYRPLAVSDFVAPAWCELQYFYSLSKYGKIRRTAAMKKGSEVHKKLELEVHDYVPVEVQTKEDSWGLRIWNVIQGLRALRATGITRELDVWGVVDGEVVSGIIDEISTVCPDSDLEAAFNASVESVPPPNQRTITEFWAGPTTERRNTAQTKYYISDTKTRNSPTLPNQASLKQVKVQLMLYHYIVNLLANDKVSSNVIFTRYNLDPDVGFSDTFLGELQKLESDIGEDLGISSDFTPSLSQISTATPNLQSLWNLMIIEFQETFNNGSLAPIMSASFRYQADGTILGSKSFVSDDQHLQTYLAETLAWWRGQRQARGVEIEDAFKCRICEFAEGCDWRKQKEEETRSKRWKRGVPKPS
jgi:exonuclease V